MGLRAAGERTTSGGEVMMLAGGGVTVADCGGRAVRTAGGIAGERPAFGPAGSGGVTVRGTEGGEPVKTESVRSESFGGGAR